MPKQKVQDFLDGNKKLVKWVDKAVRVYNLEERMNQKMWGTCITIIDLKIEILEDMILELKGLKKKLKSIMVKS